MSTRRAPSERAQLCRLACLVALASALLSAGSAHAEVPPAPDARGREFRVDFSARHLDVGEDLSELSLSGDVVVTVGRYRLGGERVRLKRGPRGIGVEGGGDIAFCSCESPPVTLGYSSVTIAPPSDVLIQGAVLRAHGVPLFWLPYLWLRSPDRASLIFPSAEWRGDDGLLLGSGVHLPFASNQGRPAARALDVSGFGYLKGGARVDAHLLTPESSSFVRWDHLDGTALSVDAHGAVVGDSGAALAFDFDASRGERGRTALSSLDAAARRFDHARMGVGSSGSGLFALGVAADGQRGDELGDPFSVGPFGQLATGGKLGRSSSYGFEVGAGSYSPAHQPRDQGSETRALQRGVLEASQLLGPVLTRFAGFEQTELVSTAPQSVSKLQTGAGASVALPLMRHYGSLIHSIAPQLLGRFERQQWDDHGENVLVTSAGVETALGRPARAGAARLWLGGGVAGDPEQELRPTLQAELGSDTRWLGARMSGVAEPGEHAAEATARLRLGARGGTMLSAYAEARTEQQTGADWAQASGDLLPSWQSLGGYDREGLTTGAELTLSLWSVVALGGGADLDPLEKDLLAVRSFARYRHACGCLGLGAYASSRTGRGGFDAGISLDLMP